MNCFSKIFEDTKEVIRSRKSRKDKETQRTKRQTIIYSTLHKKIDIEQHKAH